MKHLKLKRPKSDRKAKTPLRRQVSGSAPRPAAFSYYSRRADQEATTGRQQPREQDSRKRQRIIRQLGQRFGVVIAAIVLLICVVDVLHLSSQPKIVSLATNSSNDFLQANGVYEQAAAKLFAGSLLNANKLTVQTAAVQSSLKQQFPELTDVSITLPLISHRPIVYLAPASPGLVLVTNGGRFAIDQAGKVLLPADNVSESNLQNLPVVQDQSNLQLKTGSAALPSGTIAFIKTVTAELAAKGITAQTITLPSAAYELDVKPQTANYIIKFNLHETGEAMQQVGTYLAVKQRLDQQKVIPAQYIDVRVSGRAYYQ